MRTEIQNHDWDRTTAELNEGGWSMLAGLVSADEASAVASLYGHHQLFRSTVVMARHGFGRGEYRYFSYPLPPLVSELRTTLYPHLSPIANRWNELMGIDGRFPAARNSFSAVTRMARRGPPLSC